MPDKPYRGSFPYSELSRSEQRDVLTKARIASMLSEEAWFRVANELIAAMKLLEPRVKDYWDCVNAQFLGQNSNPEPEHSLVNVHMMLAGFAIENLCKGYLAGRLSAKARDAVKDGALPKSLQTHNISKLVQRTGITLSETKKYLVEQIGQAIWRGRYPSPVSHREIRPHSREEVPIFAGSGRFCKDYAHMSELNVCAVVRRKTCAGFVEETTQRSVSHSATICNSSAILRSGPVG
jgi:hypothetical protein